MKTSQRTGQEIDAQVPDLPRFDDEGVRLAILAAVQCVYERFPDVTLQQYLIVLEVYKRAREGSPHTLASLVKKLKIPFSTLSRIVWSLTAEGGDVGVIRYESHPTDRRKKLLVMHRQNLPSEVSRAATRALVEYYGDSLRNLKAH